MGAGESTFAAIAAAAGEGGEPVQISTRLEPATNQYSRETADKLKEARSLVAAGIWTEAEFQADKKALLSSGASVLDDAKFDAPDGILQGISVAAHGFRLNNAMLVPVGPHSSSEIIFDLNMLRQYAAANFHKEPRAEITKIEETSLEAFAHSLEASVTVSGEAGFKGSSVSGSLSAELGLSSATQQSSHYIQHRKSYVFGHVTLPGVALGVKRIQALMDPDTLTALKAIDSEKKADKMVKAFGPFFIHSATFGCIATFTSIVKRKVGESSMSAGLAVEAAAKSLWMKGSVQGSLEVSTDESHERSNSKITIRKLGGEPTAAADENAWLATGATAPVLIKYSLKTIDLLLEDETPAAKLLRQACDRVRNIKVKEIEKLAGQYDLEFTSELPPGEYEFWNSWYGEEDRYMQWSDPHNHNQLATVLGDSVLHKKKSTDSPASTFRWHVARVTGRVVTIKSAYALTAKDCGVLACMDPLPDNGSPLLLVTDEFLKDCAPSCQWKISTHDKKNQQVSFQNVGAGLFLNSHDLQRCHMWRYEQMWKYRMVSNKNNSL